MTRIVAGRFRGRRLDTPKGDRTRPTTDRVREALFSRLDHFDVLAGARVLDLYAGSGALAFEALSRGAAQAVLVESARSVAAVAGGNARDLGVADVVSVVTGSAVSYVPQVEQGAFRVVFIDPPYEVANEVIEAICGRLAVPGVLDPDAVVVVERSSRTAEPVWPLGLECFDGRTYGETQLWFVQLVAAEEDATLV
ncbi:16S rRNA (guanine(966)-N(2))-methyltransferase RsmD [Dermatophilus congolensis]|uniref:16S rRNA (guanine(966)-N(2))-methyltransferase RsmD n=1 Tax=Dermatophilus congolensis TaxID=1863 RepID=UPI000482CE5C|nr:16S rRNA (guanine(966)-N(2))-methyltransferase RsmD [Dermatophilus congolensis]